MKKLFLILALVYSANSIAVNYTILPEAITKQAELHSWDSVINDIFADQTAANMVLLAIDSGQPEWLNLALTMLDKTDNQRTQAMIVMSLGEALQWNPEQVLKQVVKAVPIKQLCSVEGVYEWRLMSQFLANEAIQRRILSVSQVASFKLAKAKAECLAVLNESKGVVAKQLSNLP
jgi:hypothetical protein